MHRAEVAKRNVVRDTIRVEAPTDQQAKARGANWLLIFLIGRHPVRTLIRAGLLAAFCIVIFRHALLPVVVSGDSMYPAYRNGQLGFANGLAYARAEPQRGDVVVIEMTGRSAMYLKRVLALPGDEVRFSNGALLVNGQVVNEPYIEVNGTWTTASETLGPHDYFVAGDNRSGPWQWHAMGVVDRDQIAGRILF